MKNEIHIHNCHICAKDFECSKENCFIEDRYAVCDSKECIREFEEGLEL